MVKYFSIISVALLCSACVERKARLWIEPPIGYGPPQSGRELTYKVEEVETGKKESLSIPISQLPENLMVEDQRRPKHDEGDLPAATSADRLFHDHKLAEQKTATVPTASYFRGITEVENLYHRQQFSEALIHLSPLVQQYPDQSRLFMMQGTLYRKLGEKKMAYLAFKKAHELNADPKIEDAMMKTGDELEATGGAR